jgi:hypothetical protein
MRDDRVMSEWTPAGNVGGPGPAAPVPPPERVDGGASSLAAMGIVVAVALLLLGALITGLSLEDTGDEGWKVTAKVLGLSSVSFMGFSSGGALMAAIALLVAYGLAYAGSVEQAGIGLGILVAAGYLLVVVLVGVYVDIDALGNADQAKGVIAGGLVGDLGAAVAAATAAWAGFNLLSSR